MPGSSRRTTSSGNQETNHQSIISFKIFFLFFHPSCHQNNLLAYLPSHPLSFFRETRASADVNNPTKTSGCRASGFAAAAMPVNAATRTPSAGLAVTPVLHFYLLTAAKPTFAPLFAASRSLLAHTGLLGEKRGSDGVFNSGHHFPKLL